MRFGVLRWGLVWVRGLGRSLFLWTGRFSPLLSSGLHIFLLLWSLASLLNGARVDWVCLWST